MRHATCVVAAGLLFGATGVAHQAGSLKPAAWPAGMIRVDAMVEDARGQSVSGLARDDFEIFSDGQPRPIEFFSSDPSPLSVAVLVDVTASLDRGMAGIAGLPSSAGTTTVGRGMPSVPGNRIAVAVEEFALKGVRPDDRVRVGAIGRRLSLSERFTGDSPALMKSWRALFERPPIEWLGPSPIWDAVTDTTASFAGESDHRAIILISDGEASGNIRSRREASEQAALMGVSVSIIAEEAVSLRMPVTRLAAVGIDPASALRATADATGGAYLLDPFGTGRDVSIQRSEFLQRLLNRLHQAYVLGFRPAIADGRMHTVEVRAKTPGMTVKARKTYAANATAGTPQR